MMKPDRPFLRKITVLQQDQQDCGVAVLQTIIAWHGGSSRAEDVRRYSGTHRAGTTMLGLYQAARRYGLDPEGVEMDIPHLLAQKQPCILHTISEQGHTHYMVFFGQDGGGMIWFGDPARGLVSMDTGQLESCWQSRAALLLVPNTHFRRCNPKAHRDTKWSWIRRSLREDYPLLGISMLIGLLLAVLGLTTAFFTQQLIDKLLPSGELGRISLGVCLLLAVLISQASMQYLRRHLLLIQGRQYSERLTGTFLDRLLRLPKSFFDSRKTGDLITRLQDTQRIQHHITYLAGHILIDLLILLASLGLLFAYSWEIGLLLCLNIPVITYIIWYHSRPITRGQQQIMAAYGEVESLYIDTIQGMQVIQSFGQENLFTGQAKDKFALFQQKLFVLGQTGNRFGLVSELTAALLTALLIGLGAYQVISGQLLIGQLIALITITGNMLPAINRLAQSNIPIQEARIAFDRMYELVGTSGEEASDDTGIPAPAFGCLVFDRVGFAFAGRSSLFQEVSLRISTGDWLCLLGKSGSGKSILLQLAQKFQTPSAGRIHLNGIDLSGISTAGWRAQVAYVPQESKLFNGSLYHNITLSQPASPADMEALHRFCVQHGFDRYFMELPQDYLSILGEDGIKLSGGQKQLVALARALYRQPALLLLDEVTASMDRQTEENVLRLLRSLKNRMGILMVTHRPSTLRYADQIYILQEEGLKSIIPSEIRAVD